MVARGREEWSWEGWTTHFVFISVIYPASIKLNGITPTESVAEDAFSFDPLDPGFMHNFARSLKHDFRFPLLRLLIDDNPSEHAATLI